MNGAMGRVEAGARKVGEGRIFEDTMAMKTFALAVERAERAEPEAEILRSVATLAATASHEINNPLMAVIGNLELLAQTQTLDAYGRMRLNAALDAAGEITEKVRRLGRITRLELVNDGPNLPQMFDLEKSSPASPGMPHPPAER